MSENKLSSREIFEIKVGNPQFEENKQQETFSQETKYWTPLRE